MRYSVVGKSSEIAYVCLAYVNKDGTEVTIVHLLPNADATDHLQPLGGFIRLESE